MTHGEIHLLYRYGKRVFSLAPLVIVLWILIAVGLNVLVPQLEKTIADKSVSFFPHSNSGIIALENASREFHQPPASGMTNIVFADKEGISAEDNAFYQRLMQRLTDSPAAKKHMAYVFDIYNQSAIKQIVTSKDHQAFYLTLVLRGELGSSQTEKAWEWLKQTVHDPQLHKPDSLEVKITGPSSIFVEELHAIDRSLFIITAVSVVVIVVMLLLAYRSWITACIPLMNIGISLVIARAIISLGGQQGWIQVSSFSTALSTAIVLGAGTDYAVFLLGSYHESRRKNIPVQEALARATGRVSGIIIASGLTIATASYSMVFMHIGLFRTAGPPIAIGVLVSLCVSLTFCPAIMSIAIRFFSLDPRNKDTSSYWRAKADRVISRPLPLALGLIVVLLACTGLTVGMHTGYVETDNYSSRTESNQGFALSDRHFLPYTMLTEYINIHSDHDMRNTTDLAALELASQAIATYPTVAKVQSITRPDGTPLMETTPTYLSGLIGGKLTQGIKNTQTQLPLLRQLAQGSQIIYIQVNSAVKNLPQLTGENSIGDIAQSLVTASSEADEIIKKVTDKQTDLHTVLTKLHDGAQAMVEVINAYGQPGIDAVSQANNFLQEMDNPIPSGTCVHDFKCMKARKLFAEINQLMHGAGHAAATVLAPIPPRMDHAYRQLLTVTPDLYSFDQHITQGINQLGHTTPQLLQMHVDRMLVSLRGLESKVHLLISGLRQIRDGTQQTVNMVTESMEQLQQAANFLNDMSVQAGKSSGGYYMPVQGFHSPIYLQGKSFMISPDGKTTRLLVIFKKSPFRQEVFNSLPTLYSVAHDAMEGTSLAHATIAATGVAAVYHDFTQEVREDTLLLAVISICAVLIILMFLLRCIVAPLIIMSAVLLSFGTTIGLIVLVFQYLLGEPLHWSVMPITLMTIVAVGSDYSMLFASRIRDESTHGFNQGIITAFETTGSVITTAGIVFAVTMFALLAGGVRILEQIGCAIGMGLIIDIVLVRTILVPAVMVLLQEKTWWPSRSVTSQSQLTHEKEQIG